MSHSKKKNLIIKSGRWMKKTWYRGYRRICKAILKKDTDDINLPLPNETVNPYDVTDYIFYCVGNMDKCWCGKQVNTYCRAKRK